MDAPASSGDEPAIQVPLASRRHERAQQFQKLQHAVPAGALLFAGAQGLLAHARGLALSLALFEIAFGALLLRALLRDTRAALTSERTSAMHPDPEHRRGPNWTEILVAAVLALEGVEHWHTTGHVPRPTVLLVAVTLVLAFAHRAVERRAAARRCLRIDDDGMRVGGRRFRGFRARWSELETVRIEEREAAIVARGRRGLRSRRIDLADLRNAAEVRAALSEAAVRLARRRAAASSA